MSHPPGIAVIGMGGYAVRHHEAVAALEAAGEVRLVCTCDPAFETLTRPEWRLRERGVPVFRDYRSMLDRCAGDIAVVTIPTPIPLHAEMHAEVVGRGLAAYLEKPPTLDPLELEEMIARDAAAPVPTLVGFNFTTEPVLRALKARLLAGEFGRLLSVGLFGWWPRSMAYYRRNGWAGRLLGEDGRLILDSCLGNAFAHHVHNLLQWAGTRGMDHWTEPESVRANLWRAHPVEGADTAFVEAATETGVLLRIALSHACRGPEIQWESLRCEDAGIIYKVGHEATITRPNGRREILPLPPHDGQVANLRALLDCLRGTRDRPPTTLADSRPFVHLNALTYLSAGQIHRFAPADRTGGDADDGYLEIPWLQAAAADFLEHGRWPAGKPEDATILDRDALDRVVRGMAEKTDSPPRPADTAPLSH
jgi:predicted dehydrogenase